MRLTPTLKISPSGRAAVTCLCWRRITAMHANQLKCLVVPVSARRRRLCDGCCQTFSIYPKFSLFVFRLIPFFAFFWGQLPCTDYTIFSSAFHSSKWNMKYFRFYIIPLAFITCAQWLRLTGSFSPAEGEARSHVTSKLAFRFFLSYSRKNTPWPWTTHANVSRMSLSNSLAEKYYRMLFSSTYADADLPPWWGVHAEFMLNAE